MGTQKIFIVMGMFRKGDRLVSSQFGWVYCASIVNITDFRKIGKKM